MKIILVAALVFMMTIITAGIILPSLLHIYGGFLVFAYLTALFLVYGNSPTIFILAFVAAFFLELWHGWYLGSAILAVLATASIWQSISQFFSIEPFIKHSRINLLSLGALIGVGYLLVASMSIVFMSIEKYIYRANVTWNTLHLTVASPAIWLVTGAGLVVCLLALRLPGYKSMPATGKFYI